MTTSQKRLLLCIGGKGGVGKTLFCRTLFHFLVSEQVQVLGIDADRENPEFFDYHCEASPPVERLDFLSVDGLRQLLEILGETSPQIALVDMPGASGAATREQFERFDIFNTLKQELGDYQVTIIAVLNNCFNSIGSLQLMMQAFGDKAQYVAVLSQMWALNHSRFQRWQQSSKRDTFLQLDGVEIQMPLMELEVFDTLHGLALPFSHQDELGLGDRILLRSFLNRSRAAFAPAAGLLGLPPLELADATTTQAITQKTPSAKKTSAKRSARTVKKPAVESSTSSEASPASHSSAATATDAPKESAA